jgi:hypothetical protein
MKEFFGFHSETMPRSPVRPAPAGTANEP